MSCPRCPHCIAAGKLGIVCPDDPGLEAPDRRCQAQVAGGTYREAGRCQKWKNLTWVKVNGKMILACPHHVAVHKRGGKIEVAAAAGRKETTSK